jgi:CO/xanthine dehydrogenase FAD-binding subunit
MSFEVVNPHSLIEALDALAADPTLIPLAGATDLMVYLEAGSMPDCTFLNLQRLEELKRLKTGRTSLVFGALTTYRDVRVSDARRALPMLALAAREVGALAIQSRGTWVGNIANASPAADGVPAMMAYDADLELASKTRRRIVPLSRFYRGYKQMDRRAGMARIFSKGRHPAFSGDFKDSSRRTNPCR